MLGWFCHGNSTTARDIHEDYIGSPNQPTSITGLVFEVFTMFIQIHKLHIQIVVYSISLIDFLHIYIYIYILCVCARV